MQTSVIGYPRIGRDRELKFASEKYFKGEISEKELNDVADEIRKINYKKQLDRGITYIASNDFSFYDNVLDTAVIFNVIPKNIERNKVEDFVIKACDFYTRHLRQKDRER